MQVIECDNNIIVTIKIGDQEFGLREFTMDDQEFLSTLSEENSIDGLKSVLVRCGLPEDQVGKIPLRKVKEISDVLTGVMSEKK